MLLQDYEIRNIDGKEIFVKDIGFGLWLFDDVIVCFTKFHEVSDDDIMFCIVAKNREILPYRGSKDGWVMVLTPLDDGFFETSECHIDDFQDSNITNLINGALDMYRQYKHL